MEEKELGVVEARKLNVSWLHFVLSKKKAIVSSLGIHKQAPGMWELRVDSSALTSFQKAS